MTSNISIDLLRTPEEYALFDIYPIQPRSVTLIGYSLPKESRVNLSILDLCSPMVIQLHVHEKQPAGYYSRFWDHRDAIGARITGNKFLLRIEAAATDGSGPFVKEQQFYIVPVAN